MRAYAFDQFGEEGSLREMELPAPAEGQVRLKVSAASVNPIDWKTAKGWVKDYLEHRFPLVTGQDVCGTVDAVGPGVDDLKLGDVVFGTTGQPFMGRGTHAEYVNAATATLCRKPESLSDEAAASLPLAGVTAQMCVEAIQPSPGQVVLIVAAAGVVGSIAVQLAAARGAKVIGVARQVNHDYLRQLGAAEMIDYTAEDLATAVRAAHPAGIDAIIDLASDHATARKLTGLLRDGGIMASPNGTAPMDDPRVKGAFIVADVTRDRLQQLVSAIEAGALKVAEIHGYGFQDAVEALRESEGGHVRGKLVLTMR